MNGRGSIRISDTELQKSIFAALGLSEEEASNNLASFIEAV